MHVGGGGCTRAATLEKLRCFPKLRQLSVSPLPLTTLPTLTGGGGSEESKKTTRLHHWRADHHLARDNGGKHILLVMHYFFTFDPVVESIHGRDGNGE